MIMASWLGKVRRTPITVLFVILFFLGLGAVGLLQASGLLAVLQLQAVQADATGSVIGKSSRIQALRIREIIYLCPAAINVLVGGGILARKRWAQRLGIVLCSINLIACFSVVGFNFLSLVFPNFNFGSSMSGNGQTRKWVDFGFEGLGSRDKHSTRWSLIMLLKSLSSLKDVWLHAFIGCLLLNDRSLKRYISSNIKQT
jgi:hypothetical protein